MGFLNLLLWKMKRLPEISGSRLCGREETSWNLVPIKSTEVG